LLSFPSELAAFPLKGLPIFLLLGGFSSDSIDSSLYYNECCTWKRVEINSSFLSESFSSLFLRGESEETFSSSLAITGFLTFYSTMNKGST